MLTLREARRAWSTCGAIFRLPSGMRATSNCFARDHFGIKPFYYAQLENFFVFSNKQLSRNSEPQHHSGADRQLRPEIAQKPRGLDDRLRGFFRVSRIGEHAHAIADIGGSGMAVATILSREPKRAANGVEKPVMATLSHFVPIFFRRRKGEPEQISRRGKQAAAHA